MKPKRKAIQLAMHCRCGRETMLAHGMCTTCYTLRRPDEEHFGGRREAVLERDGYRCRVCDALGTGKRSIIVHHRVPGRSELKSMISLCAGCHARVHGTKAVLATMPPLLLVPWRKQHPNGHEQTGSTSGESTLPLNGWRYVKCELLTSRSASSLCTNRDRKGRRGAREAEA